MRSNFTGNPTLKNLGLEKRPARLWLPERFHSAAHSWPVLLSSGERRNAKQSSIGVRGPKAERHNGPDVQW